MYIVFGATGFLGSYLIKSILEQTSDNIIAVARSIGGNLSDGRVIWFECDITNPNQVDALAKTTSQNRSNKFIDLAFWHNIDTVASNPKDAWDTNITALAYLLNKLENPACFFFASTDCVYGEGSPGGSRFKESDTLNPISLYGTHKAAAECLVRACGYNVLRLPYMFGSSLVPGKKHFYDIISDSLKQGNPVDLFYDSLRNALDFKTVAELFVRLAENFEQLHLPGVLNLCGDEDLSKYDLGVLLANKLALSSDLLNAVSSQSLNTAPNAARALNGLMDNSLLKTTLGISELKIVV